MTVLKKEMKQGNKGIMIWMLAIGFMLVACVLMYPEMKSEMDSVSEIFSNMGGFTAAFGMDKLNFGTLIGFYGVECGNIIGIGGGLFAAFIGISMLSKEEKEHTAEFLLTHPVSRLSVIFEKLTAVILEILILNAAITVMSLISIVAIGEDLPINNFLLIHLGYLILQLELGIICFGISAFLNKGSIGLGIGMAALLYFLNIIRNISDKADFLKYITPFAYAEPADIVESGKLSYNLILFGFVYTLIVSVVGIIHYYKKDIK